MPKIVAQTIPPSALKTRKRGQGRRLTPARKAAKARRTATKRPKNTILPPWRRNRYCPTLSRPSSSFELAAVFVDEGEAELAPDPIARVVAGNRRDRRAGDDEKNVQRARAGENRRGNQHGLAGHGNSGALKRDKNQHGEVAVVVDERLQVLDE